MILTTVPISAPVGASGASGARETVAVGLAVGNPSSDVGVSVGASSGVSSGIGNIGVGVAIRTGPEVIWDMVTVLTGTSNPAPSTSTAPIRQQPAIATPATVKPTQSSVRSLLDCSDKASPSDSRGDRVL